MSPGGLTAWPPLALLLLWLPDCVPLSGPSKVTGTVGGSLTVQCHYGEEFKDNDKLWCKKSLVLCKDIVKTRGSEGEVQSGRVSISDHPANLSFTVTMERLTLEDAGSYECRVDTPWHKGFDPYFKVEVAVLPGEPLPPCPEVIPCTVTELLPGAQSPTWPSPALCRLPVLLLLLSLLLLLLVGSLLLVWRRLQKRVKGEPLDTSSWPPQAAGQSEPYYANLTLQTWSLQEEPVPPRQAEVEYSMLVSQTQLHTQRWPAHTCSLRHVDPLLPSPSIPVPRGPHVTAISDIVCRPPVNAGEHSVTFLYLNVQQNTQTHWPWSGRAEGQSPRGPRGCTVFGWMLQTLV
uniref:Ig-like domain-containing protein n=1 Tax=Spermophilus dauricus TaxID=99837 RepID=A0A8C9QP79_SPEDA